MTSDEIKRLKKIIEKEVKNSSNVFITGHVTPDFDSIGACIGISYLMKQFNKKSYIIVDDDDAKIQAGVKRIIDESHDSFTFIRKEEMANLWNEKSLLIVTDTNKKYMVSIEEELDQFQRIIIIDHHEEDEKSIQTKYKLINSSYSSASEIVTELLLAFKIKNNKDVVSYLLAGVTLDTLQYEQNTTSKTHKVAQQLIDRGANIDYVNELKAEEFECYCRVSDLITRGTVWKKYGKYLINPIQVSFTLKRDDPKRIYRKEDLAKASNQMKKFTGIDAAFVLGFIDEDKIHISGRGGKKVDIRKIMQEMGGGGTSQSGAAIIESDDILAVEKELMSKVPTGIAGEGSTISNSPKVLTKANPIFKEKRV